MSRGVAPRAHQYPKPPVPPTVFLMASPFTPPEELRAKGAGVVLIDDVRWKRCNVKTTQLLPNVMAKQEAFEHDCLDAIFIRDGLVTETSHANVMAVVNGTLWTHPIDGSVLPGVTRDVVLELAKQNGVPVREEGMTVDAFRKADEVFLVGTLSDVMPIVKVDGKQVGSGKPGPVSLKLFKALRERLDALRR
jgi:D-alanine transaminase